VRANEKFSGRGHARHLCKDCARLGKEELAYRQEIRNLERLLGYQGHVPRKKLKQFQKYLEHENPRVRAYAEQIALDDALERAELRLQMHLDQALFELAIEEGGFSIDVTDSDDDVIPMNETDIPTNETEIPF